MHTCPNCNFEIEDSSIEICPKCNFDFNDTLSCNYKLSNRCIHTQKKCDIHGLNYETCPIYLHKTGIEQ